MGSVGDFMEEEADGLCLEGGLILTEDTMNKQIFVTMVRMILNWGVSNPWSTLMS